MNLFKKMEKHFTKAEETEAKYIKAYEAKEEEILKLQAELQEKEKTLKDLHKESLLGNISEATFEAEKEKVEKLQNKITAYQKELSIMEVYKTEDVKAVLQ